MTPIEELRQAAATLRNGGGHPSPVPWIAEMPDDTVQPLVAWLSHAADSFEKADAMFGPEDARDWLHTSDTYALAFARQINQS